MADSSIPEGLPEGIGPHEVALMGWSAKERGLLATQRMLEHVEEATGRLPVGEMDGRVLALIHARNDLAEASALPVQDADADAAWMVGQARFLEALVELREAGLIN